MVTVLFNGSGGDDVALGAAPHLAWMAHVASDWRVCEMNHVDMFVVPLRRAIVCKPGRVSAAGGYAEFFIARPRWTTSSPTSFILRCLRIAATWCDQFLVAPWRTDLLEK